MGPGVTGSKVYLAPGTYDATLGERFPLRLRNGTSLYGAGPAPVTIRGTGRHEATGGSNDGVYFATMLAGDGTLPTVVSRLTMASESATPTPAHFGFVGDRGDSPEGSMAVTLLEDVAIPPGYVNAVMAVSSVTPYPSACKLRMRNVTITGASWGLVARGCAWNTIDGLPVSLDIGDEGADNTFSWMRTLTNDGAGLLIHHCVARTSIRHNVFSDSTVGVLIHQYDSRIGNSRFVIQHNAFLRHTWTGLFLRGNSPRVDDLSDNRFEGITDSILGDYSDAARFYAAAMVIHGDEGTVPFVRARRNRFIGNDSGIAVSGPNLTTFDALGPLDFGTEQSPGHNPFVCNGRRGVAFGSVGGDIELHLPAQGRFALVGNVWDHAPPSVGDGAAADGTDIISWLPNQLAFDVHGATALPGGCP